MWRMGLRGAILEAGGPAGRLPQPPRWEMMTGFSKCPWGGGGQYCYIHLQRLLLTLHPNGQDDIIFTLQVSSRFFRRAKVTILILHFQNVSLITPFALRESQSREPPNLEESKGGVDGGREMGRGGEGSPPNCAVGTAFTLKPRFLEDRRRDSEQVSFWCPLLFPCLRIIKISFSDFCNPTISTAYEHVPSFKQRREKETARTTQMNLLANVWILIFPQGEGLIKYKTLHSALAQAH